MPTNEAVRNRSEIVFSSILHQIEKLIFAHNRRVADDTPALEEHIFTLIKNGLNAKEMTSNLIERFHELKFLIKDRLLINKLEEAFVASGTVKMLDDDSVSAGALIKYHNPDRHASPGMQRAIEGNGGREAMLNKIAKVQEKYPQFAYTRLGLRDERLAFDDVDDDGED